MVIAGTCPHPGAEVMTSTKKSPPTLRTELAIMALGFPFAPGAFRYGWARVYIEPDLVEKSLSHGTFPRALKARFARQPGIVTVLSRKTRNEGIAPAAGNAYGLAHLLGPTALAFATRQRMERARG